MAISYDTGRINWTYRGTNVTGFIVKAGTVSGTYQFALTVNDPAARSALVKEVVPSPGTYFSVVVAVNQVGEGPPSAESSFEALPSPPSAPGAPTYG